MALNDKSKNQDQDDNSLREKLDCLYEQKNQIALSKWSLTLAKHILEIANISDQNNAIIDAFVVTELWQVGKARMHDVRQAGFKIHQIAKECDNEIEKTVFRVVGQAVGTGHMREHAMVASDYAVKVIKSFISQRYDRSNR